MNERYQNVVDLILAGQGPIDAISEVYGIDRANAQKRQFRILRSGGVMVALDASPVSTAKHTRKLTKGVWIREPGTRRKGEHAAITGPSLGPEPTDRPAECAAGDIFPWNPRGQWVRRSNGRYDFSFPRASMAGTFTFEQRTASIKEYEDAVAEENALIAELGPEVMAQYHEYRRRTFAGWMFLDEWNAAGRPEGAKTPQANSGVSRPHPAIPASSQGNVANSSSVTHRIQSPTEPTRCEHGLVICSPCGWRG